MVLLAIRMLMPKSCGSAASPCPSSASSLRPLVVRADIRDDKTYVTITGTLLAYTAKVLSGAQARWVDCQPDTCQRVYFANHTSHLDPLVIWGSLPRDVRNVTRPVAAKDYWSKGPVKPYFAKAFNALLIDRKKIKVHQSPIDLMLREIGDTYSLIVFPEGGRNTETEIRDFKSGIYYLAKKRPEP